MENSEKWNGLAADFQRTYLLGLNEYDRLFLQFLQGMLVPGGRVLDIGCGVGKYGVRFAQAGCSVTLADISGEMLALAAENMRPYTAWQTVCCDFEQVSGLEPAFRGGFDLTICTMSPAVHDLKTVRLMSAMTRGWCVTAQFSGSRQPCREALLEGLIPDGRVLSVQSVDCEALIRAVAEAGYRPQVRTVSYSWSDRRTPEEMADYLYRHFLQQDPGPRAEICTRAAALCGPDGKLDDAVDADVSWISWQTAV